MEMIDKQSAIVFSVLVIVPTVLSADYSTDLIHNLKRLYGQCGHLARPESYEKNQGYLCGSSDLGVRMTNFINISALLNNHDAVINESTL